MEAVTNINLAKCIVVKNHIGYDTMVNFCTGKESRVDWVPLDWVNAGALIVFLLMMFAAIGYLAAYISSDPY
jgi:hypothetical protein